MDSPDSLRSLGIPRGMACKVRTGPQVSTAVTGTFRFQGLGFRARNPQSYESGGFTRPCATDTAPVRPVRQCVGCLQTPQNHHQQHDGKERATANCPRFPALNQSVDGLEPAQSHFARGAWKDVALAGSEFTDKSSLHLPLRPSARNLSKREGGR